MSVSVSFASPFLRLAGGSKNVEGNGRNVGELIEALESRFPGIRAPEAENDPKDSMHGK